MKNKLVLMSWRKCRQSVLSNKGERSTDFQLGTDTLSVIFRLLFLLWLVLLFLLLLLLLVVVVLLLLLILAWSLLAVVVVAVSVIDAGRAVESSLVQ